MTEYPTTSTPIAEAAREFAPVVWLVGKVQSGKTSIIQTMTQSSDAEIGAGFRACTRTARIYDFPEQAPIIRFLDTRGLGEAGYDPTSDIAFCEGRTHLVLAVIKAMDVEQSAVLTTLREARRRHPDWPIVVAQTSLHEGYPAGKGHIHPYPYYDPAQRNIAVPDVLAKCLAYQEVLFRELPGQGALAFAPIDFTQPGDGFQPEDYGREALVTELMNAAPRAAALALSELPGAGDSQRTNAHVLGFAIAAGASDAVPVAGALAVPLVQAAMLRQLAKLHGIEWDRRAYTEFIGALGTGTLVRTASTFGIRQLMKLVPVYGQTIGAAAAAAASFAATYALGQAAVYFLNRRRKGLRAEQVASIYRTSLERAFGFAPARGLGGKP